MKIYFAGSIRGGRENVELYNQIIKNLSQYGKVLTEHIGDKNLTGRGEVEVLDNKIYERDVMWLKESDIVVAEISMPSLGVGYEIGLAESFNKKILCLFKNSPDKRVSAMIAGNPNIEVFYYSSAEDLKVMFDQYFAVIL